MKPEKAYLIGRVGGYGAASAMLAVILAGCSTGKTVSEVQTPQYKVPQALIEMHERMMAGQHQLIIPDKNDENTDD